MQLGQVSTSQSVPVVRPVRVYAEANPEEDVRVFSVMRPSRIIPGSVFATSGQECSETDPLEVELASWQAMGVGALANLDQMIDDLEDLEGDETG